MYKLEHELLTKYAKVMVHYAIGNGNGLNKGETVFLIGQECTKDLYLEICKEIWRSGGNVIHRYLPDEVGRYGINRSLLEIGTDEQLTFFPTPYWQGVTDVMDHILFIIADPDMHALDGILAEKICKMEESKAPFMEMREKKESVGKLSWTLCLYGTESMAKEAGINLQEYWEQIINACYLQDEDPVATWRNTKEEIVKIKSWLSELKIERVHVEADGIDLWIKVGADRKWLGASGHNIPSFEVFTSPDWRGTSGKIFFNQPLYYQCKRISGIQLEFKNGVITHASAAENEDTLLQMIAIENANKIGEFSLTDRRHSRITKPMATTLFDENMGGKYGNTHIALGMSYKEAFVGDIGGTTDEGWEARGFNLCHKVHTDIISTANRKVTATLANGESLVIYENGQFTVV